MSATEAEIKSAYRTLSHRYHPDRNPSPIAAERFRAVQDAWALLGTPTAKKKVDNELRSVIDLHPEQALQSMVSQYLQKFS